MPFDLRWLGAVSLSLVVAFMLATVPLPEWINHWRPAWVALTVIYWSIAMPERFGVLSAWALGVLLDVMHGSLLGQHALGLAFVAFVSLLYHQRIRVYPMLQQALVVGSIVFLYEGWLLVIFNTLGSRPYPVSYLLGVCTSALLWPWLFIVLRDLRRYATG